MRILVDGSNVLGAMGLERESSESKRHLLRLLVAYGRAHRRKLTCFFDGERPADFGAGPGAIQIRFCAPVSADDSIVAEVERKREPFRVVTSDRGIAMRVKRRDVETVDARQFIRELESIPEGEPPTGTDVEWESYFSDPKNRNV